MAQAFYALRVSLCVHFTSGNPLETEEDIAATFDFLKQMPFDPTYYERTYPRMFALEIMPQAPLGKMFPQISARVPYETANYYKCIFKLREVIKDDGMFFLIHNNLIFKEKPNEPRIIFLETLAKERFASLAASADRLAGQEVYFWGCGELYRTHKHLFHRCRPRAILIPQKAEPVWTVFPCATRTKC